MRAPSNVMVRGVVAVLLVAFGMTLFSMPSSAACCYGAYNRTAARQYADQYWQNPNPSYPYYGLNDCTNFISQALLQGGVLEHSVNGMINDHRNWFWGRGPHSNSWSVADMLMRHAYAYLGNRFNANLTVGTYSSQKLRAGDFIVWDAQGDPRSGPATHGRIGVGWLWDSQLGAYYYKMNQHSPSRKHVFWNQFWLPDSTNNWKISVHG